MGARQHAAPDGGVPLRLLLAAVLACAAALPHELAGQGTPVRIGHPVHPGAITISLLAGGSAFSKLQPVTVETPGGETYPAALALSTTTTLGAEVSYWLRNWLGLRLQGSYAPGEFQLRMREERRDSLLGPDAGPSDLRFSDVSAYTYAGAAVLNLPLATGRTQPYALLGAGAVSYGADEQDARGLEAAFEGSDRSTRVAGLAGLGLRVPLREGSVALTFELTDHVSRTPVPGDDDRLLLDTEGFDVFNRHHPEDSEGSTRYVHDVSFFVGLFFRFGGGEPVPADPPAEPDAE